MDEDCFLMFFMKVNEPFFLSVGVLLASLCPGFHVVTQSITMHLACESACFAALFSSSMAKWP